MEKRIKDFEDYVITDEGKVISYKYKTPKILATYYQKSGYENIKLSKNNTQTHKLVHRLVAEAFIPNPDNLPEVNHKDKNVKNNNANNLEWCTRKQNLEDSYITMSPTRNYRICNIVKIDSNVVIKQCKSVKEAAEYCFKHFNCSIDSMRKYYKSNGYRLEFIEGVETKID